MSLDESNKLFLYKNIKHCYQRELYLNISDFNLRRCFAKFRLCEHDLEIAGGRLRNIPRIQRLCKACNSLEDELHFFFHCSFNQIARTNYYHHISSIFNATLSDQTNFPNIFSSDNTQLILHTCF